MYVCMHCQLMYYTDETRSQMKGEILLVGATINSSPSGDTKKQKMFTISHPITGQRELACKTDHRRTQWVQHLTEIVQQLDKSGAMCGTVFKKVMMK